MFIEIKINKEVELTAKSVVVFVVDIKCTRRFVPLATASKESVLDSWWT
tara:strand:- start:1213 stop:1359 length:147 start_codon:yes stop_codon:yes gene_type:complete